MSELQRPGANWSTGADDSVTRPMQPPPSRTRAIGPAGPPRLLRLASRRLSDHDVVRLARDRRGDASAERLHQLARGVAGERGEGAGDDERLAGERLGAIERDAALREIDAQAPEIREHASIGLVVEKLWHRRREGGAGAGGPGNGPP